MANKFEIVFLTVGDNRSGDAICMRYFKGGKQIIHLVDGGYVQTGDDIINLINQDFNEDSHIDHIVVTHNHKDHTNGLKTVLKKFNVGCLWMNLPWKRIDDILPKGTIKEKRELVDYLKSEFKNLADLEEIANDENPKIKIRSAFSGEKIGKFTVLSPSKKRFVELVKKYIRSKPSLIEEHLRELVAKALPKIKDASWDEEYLVNRDEHDIDSMSIVQFGVLRETKILLTGDSGKRGLGEAIEFAKKNKMNINDIDFLQVPHHGSFINLTPDVLNYLVGVPFNRFSDYEVEFCAYISAVTSDIAHPNEFIIHALYRRGGEVFVTGDDHLSHSSGMESRKGWKKVTPEDYPGKI